MSSLSRRNRRLQRRLRLVGQDGVPPPPRPPGDTPVERFARYVDTAVQAYCKANADLQGLSVCSTLLQLSAALAVELGGNAEEFAGAAGQLFEREQEARTGRSGA